MAIIILNASLSTTTTTMARTVTHTLYSTFNNNNNENVFYYTRPSVSYMWERLYSLGRNKGVRILVYYNYDAKGSLMTTTSTTTAVTRTATAVVAYQSKKA